MKRIPHVMVFALSLMLLSGCVAYAPYGDPYPAAYTPYGGYGYSYGYSAPVVPVPVPMYRGGWGYGRHGGWGHHGHHGFH
jgi:hypothetical protein